MVERRVAATFFAPELCAPHVLTGRDLDLHDSYTNGVKRWLRDVVLSPFESMLKSDALAEARTNLGFEGDVPPETYRTERAIAGIDHEILLVRRTNPAYGRVFEQLETIIDDQLRKNEHGLRSDGVVRTNMVYIDPRLMVSTAHDLLGEPTPSVQGRITRYEDGEEVDLEEPESSMTIVFDPAHYRTPEPHAARAALTARRFIRQIDAFEERAIEHAIRFTRDETPATWYVDDREVSLTKRSIEKHEYSKAYRTLFEEHEGLTAKLGDLNFLSQVGLDTRIEQGGRLPLAVNGTRSRKGSKHGVITIERRGAAHTYPVYERDGLLYVGLEGVREALAATTERFTERGERYVLDSKRIGPARQYP